MEILKKIWNNICSFLKKEQPAIANANAVVRKKSWRIKSKFKNPPVASVNNEKIHYLLNDMSTPDLFKEVLPSSVPKVPPKFQVVRYEGGGFDHNQVQFQSANCFCTISNTIDFLNKMSEKKIDSWAGTKNLLVNPRAGKDLNAFYNRASMQFFYVDSPKTGAVYTADSADIVAHELGHAILDFYRPDAWGAASLEVWSFHEAFADFTAMMNIMSHDQILKLVLEQTNNDIKIPNIISNLSEHLGQVIYKVAKDNSRSPDYLRSAINDFKYVNPGTLPKRAPNNKLAAECHSFGRVFLGALYDIIVMIYEKAKNDGHDPFKSLKHARDAAAKRVLFSIQNAPMNVKFYESIAKTMLWAEKTKFSGVYHDKMRDIFFNRNLMKPELKILSAPICDNNEHIVKMHGKMNIKLGDYLIRAQSENPLYNVEVEIPCEQVYLYDENKNIYDYVTISDEDSMSAAQDAISYLYEMDQVGSGNETPFEIIDGKLRRTLFN